MATHESVISGSYFRTLGGFERVAYSVLLNVNRIAFPLTSRETGSILSPSEPTEVKFQHWPQPAIAEGREFN